MIEYIEDPDSEAIAGTLNAVPGSSCPHRRNPCIMRCGVEQPSRSYRITFLQRGDAPWAYRATMSLFPGGRPFWRYDPEGATGIWVTLVYLPLGPWTVIPQIERQRWHNRVEELSRRDRETSR